ncbi:MAG: hypothetical protein EWV81_04445 [Microcystis aeruginosa Ma_SC_T_19800800_S464]|uniref:Uncharacterized protein n=1 Tax=Microcystis aeruginosa Ma_SC_T_19800800_S464 TaxID=2486257 RepID=A0A552E2G0_MICAE|nr:MAG: hypothetical protein EWV81_04445 [Microcystis aeruginosa Ma_SC_T_19800800_S464]
MISYQSSDMSFQFTDYCLLHTAKNSLLPVPRLLLVISWGNLYFFPSPLSGGNFLFSTIAKSGGLHLEGNGNFTITQNF